MKIIMICLGNICRSPLAEGLLRYKCEQLGLDWEIDSAGTGAYHIGQPPHLSSQKIALDHNIDISTLRARQLESQDGDYFDHLFVMDQDNYRDVKAIVDPAHHHKIKLILNESQPNKNMAVPDPYYKGDAAYLHVYNLLDQACDALLKNYA